MKSLDLFEKSLYFNIDHTHLRPDDIANECLAFHFITFHANCWCHQHRLYSRLIASRGSKGEYLDNTKRLMFWLCDMKQLYFRHFRITFCLDCDQSHILLCISTARVTYCKIVTSLFVIALATFGFNIHEGESVGDRSHLKSNIACSRRSDTEAREKNWRGKKKRGSLCFSHSFSLRRSFNSLPIVWKPRSTIWTPGNR